MNFHERKAQRIKERSETFRMRLRPCTACSGSGRYCGRACGACDGTGKERYYHAPNTASTPTGGSAPVSGQLSTPESTPSNNQVSVPPHAGNASRSADCPGENMDDLHICTVCFRSMDRHSEKCECGWKHFPALCCPGCDCGSFEAAQHRVHRTAAQGQRRK